MAINSHSTRCVCNLASKHIPCFESLKIKEWFHYWQDKWRFSSKMSTLMADCNTSPKIADKINAIKENHVFSMGCFQSILRSWQNKRRNIIDVQLMHYNCRLKMLRNALKLLQLCTTRPGLPVIFCNNWVMCFLCTVLKLWTTGTAWPLILFLHLNCAKN